MRSIWSRFIFVMFSKLLGGKVCLVTGGAGGLGKVIAQAFLNSGAKVVVSDINQEPLKECESEFPSQDFRAVNADVTKEESGSRLFAAVVGQIGKLDVLVNNAGIMDHFDGLAIWICRFGTRSLQ